MPIFSSRAVQFGSGAARGASCAAALVAAALVVSCNRGEVSLAPAPAESVTVGMAPEAAPAISIAPPTPAPPVATDASATRVDSSTTACSIDADCRLFSDTCGACACRPLAKKAPAPTCAGRRMSCLIDPCARQAVTCRKGNCVIGEPGDAAAPAAAPDGAASTSKNVDAAGVGAPDARSDASAASKNTASAADASARDH